MRPLVLMGIVCLLATTASADPVTYTFEVIDGSIAVGVGGLDPVAVPIAGTFTMTVYASDGIIGESDTFLLGSADLYNDGLVVVGIPQLVTAEVQPGSFHLLDFAPDSAAHIPANGEAVTNTDVYVDVTAILTGAVDMTFATSGWLGESRPLDVTFSSLPVPTTDTFVISLGGTFMFDTYIPDIYQSVTFDQVIDIQARVIPDPSLIGLTALGVAGASAWLRRRRL